jgi:CRP-like cAMP-binding protein
VAVDDCYLLAIRREVLLDLIGQYPDLALTIIKFLSRRLREASSTIAEKTRARPRQIVDLFDKMGE